jgi:spore coat protein CotH
MKCPPRWLIYFLLCLGLNHAPFGHAQAAQPADAVFGLTNINKFHLELSADAWKNMQPAQTMRFPGFGPNIPKQPTEKSDDKPADVHKSAGAFGTEFPWVRAEFMANGKAFANVGVRYKGNFTYIASANMLRRPMKIDLDHYDEDQRLAGHKKINLSNGVTDPARARESLAFAFYRAAGVPAPRTAFAELTLTVPGKYEKEYVGLYTVIEQVDKTFLKTHFKNSKGLLLKPEGLQGGLTYLGEDWARYEPRYRPKDPATKAQQQRLIAFTRLIHKSDDVEFRKEVGSYLDIDAFVRFVAADALLANLDSYLGFGHNFYLYLRADTNQFAFIPWDLDLSLGMWPVGGPPTQQINLSLEHPHIGQNKLIDRLFTMKEVKDKYLNVLKELSATCFTKEKLLKDVDAIEQAVKDSLAREKEAAAARKESTKGGPFAGIVAQGPPLRVFVEKRVESVVAQLAGERKGYVPAGMGFGPPGGFKPGGPGGNFGPGNFLAKPLLAALDTGKDAKVSRDELAAGIKMFFKDCDKDDRGMLEEAQIAAGINRIVPRPPGFPAPQPGAFGLGNVISGSIMKRADANKDGKLSLDELTAAADAVFTEADKEKKGLLEESGVGAAISPLFAPRPGFGPPGPRAPGPKVEPISGTTLMN